MILLREGQQKGERGKKRREKTSVCVCMCVYVYAYVRAVREFLLKTSG